MPHVTQLPRPLRNMFVLGLVGAAAAMGTVVAAFVLALNINGCGNSDGEIIVGAIALSLSVSAFICHARIRSDATVGRAAAAGVLSLFAMCMTIAATVYYNTVGLNTWEDDDDGYNYQGPCISIIFFGVGTTCHIMAAIGGLLLQRRLRGGITVGVPLLYGQGGSTTVVTSSHMHAGGFHQPQPGYYHPSYPGQMPPPPSYDAAQQHYQYQQQPPPMAAAAPPSYGAQVAGASADKSAV